VGNGFHLFHCHLQATGREYGCRNTGMGCLPESFSQSLRCCFRTCRRSTWWDDIVAGTAISMAVFGQDSAARNFYTTIYTLLAAFVFSGKNY